MQPLDLQIQKQMVKELRRVVLFVAVDSKYRRWPFYRERGLYLSTTWNFLGKLFLTNRISRDFWKGAIPGFPKLGLRLTLRRATINDRARVSCARH